MFKKIIIGLLLITVIGAGVSTVTYRALASDDEAITEIPPLNDQQNTALSQTNFPQLNAQEEIEQQPWQAEGEILDLDDNGLTLGMADGKEVYVELGPNEYWQSQEITLQPGMFVQIEGTESNGMIHAYRIIETTGETLQLRAETGQPLWSGGVENGHGQNDNQGDGEQTPQPQVQVDEWVTINGSLMAFQGGNMTISTVDGEVLTIQTGQPRFLASQGVTFVVGDEVVLVGYYDGNQFVAGDITQVSTGLRVMLRDPNGRPLWAGPGNGKGNGNGGR